MGNEKRRFFSGVGLNLPGKWRILAEPVIIVGMTDFTRILNRIEQGDPSAADQLLPLVYEALKRLAASKLVHEKPGQTLQATSLVHEAYLRLVVKQAQPFESRGHFFSAAAEAMRRILVEQARRKQSLKRGGDWIRLPSIEINAIPADKLDQDERILAVHDALEQLEQSAPRQSEIVKLRFFAGMTVEETANFLGISTPTVKREWATAKVWIYRLIQSQSGDPAAGHHVSDSSIQEH